MTEDVGIIKVEVTASKTYVFDLDGTLSDHSHRVGLAQAGEWDEFHAAGHLDPPHAEMVALLQILGEKHTIVIITGRNEKFRIPTLRWLADHDAGPDYLFMRPDDDYTKSGPLKLRQLDEMFGGSREEALRQVAMVFEDRDSLVEEFRNAGFVCAQVRNGSY